MLKTVNPRLPLADAGILVLVAFVWGLNFVVIAVGLRNFPPLLFSALRFLICAFPAVFFLPKPEVRLRDLIGLGIVLGILVFAFLFLSIHAGMPTGLASLVMQIQIFFTIILGAVLLSERPELLNWLAVVIGFSGVALIASQRGSIGDIPAFLLVLASALSWGFANVMMKSMPRANMMHLMVWISLIPPIPLFMMSLALDGWPTVSASLSGMSWLGAGAVLYTSLLSTVFAYGFWGSMLQRHATNVVAPFALLIPVFGLGSASLLLGEQYSPIDALASALIVVALATNVWAGALKRALLSFFEPPRPLLGP